MAERRDEWAAWLRDQFDTHPTIKINADLVRAGGVKENGRPVIDPSTVTQWLRGRRPSYELARATARAFGMPSISALEAAGFDVETVRPSTQDGPVKPRRRRPSRAQATAAEQLADLGREFMTMAESFSQQLVEIAERLADEAEDET